MRKRILMCVVLALLLGLAGCQMMKGAAKDVGWFAEQVDAAIVEDK